MIGKIIISLAIFVPFLSSCVFNNGGIPVSTVSLTEETRKDTLRVTAEARHYNSTRFPESTPVVKPMVGTPEESWKATVTLSGIAATSTAQSWNIKRIPYNVSGWTHFGDEVGLLYNDIFSIAYAPDESVWFSGRNHYLLHFNNNQLISYTLPLQQTEETIWFGNIIVDHENKVWIAAGDAGAIQYDGKHWNRYPSTGDTRIKVDRILVGRDNRIWAVTQQTGSIFLFDGNRWVFYWSLQQTLSRPSRINDIVIDQDGKFLITESYLSTLEPRLQDQSPLYIDNVLKNEHGFSLVRSGLDKSIWVQDSITPALIHFFPGKTQMAVRVPELDSLEINTFCVAQDGSVWVGPVSSKSTGIKSILLHLEGDVWTIYDDLPFNDRIYSQQMIRSIAVSKNGKEVWLATGMGIFRLLPG